MTQPTGGARVAVLAKAAIVCSLFSGVAALCSYSASLPPTDGAYGVSPLEFVLDPFVLMVWIPIALGTGLLGFLASLVTLRDVDLGKSIPVVFVVTVAAAAVGVRVNVVVGPLFALGTSMLAMQACQSWSLWSSRHSPSHLASRDGLKDPLSRRP